MTAYAHRLIRIDGGEQWEQWGPRWWQHAQAVTDLWWVTNYHSPPAWLSDQPHRKLDWGAVLVEMPLDDVKRLIRQPASGDAEQAYDRQLRLIDALPAGRYGVIWIEDTEPAIGAGRRFEPT